MGQGSTLQVAHRSCPNQSWVPYPRAWTRPLACFYLKTIAENYRALDTIFFQWPNLANHPPIRHLSPVFRPEPVLPCTQHLGGYHFLPNRGGHEKAGVHRIFSREIGGSEKNQEIFGWLQILMKILFNEIAPKMHIFCATHIGVTCFFNIVALDGGS